jgi:hypothetical protein
MSRSLTRKSLVTKPTLLKSLSGDAEVAGTARYCLAGFAGIITVSQSASAFVHLVFKKKKGVFRFLSFFEDFSP